MDAKAACAYLRQNRKIVELHVGIYYEILEYAPDKLSSEPTLRLRAASRRGHTLKDRILMTASKWDKTTPDYILDTDYDLNEVNSILNSLLEPKLWDEIKAEIEISAQIVQIEADKQFLLQVQKAKPHQTQPNEKLVTINFQLMIKAEDADLLTSLPSEAMGETLRYQLEHIANNWRQIKDQATKLNLTPVQIAYLLKDMVDQSIKLYEKMRNER